MESGTRKRAFSVQMAAAIGLICSVDNTYQSILEELAFLGAVFLVARMTVAIRPEQVIADCILAINRTIKTKYAIDYGKCSGGAQVLRGRGRIL